MLSILRLFVDLLGLQIIPICGDDKGKVKKNLIQIAINKDHVLKGTIFHEHMNGKLYTIYGLHIQKQRNEVIIVIV